MTPWSSENVVAINSDPTLLQPFGNIVASPSLAFDFHQFHFGCGTGNTPVGCNIQVRGYKRDGKLASGQYFSYDPTTPEGLNMELATLGGNGFRDLQKVTIAIVSGDASFPATAIELYLDNVEHCNHKQ